MRLLLLGAWLMKPHLATAWLLQLLLLSQPPCPAADAVAVDEKCLTGRERCCLGLGQQQWMGSGDSIRAAVSVELVRRRVDVNGTSLPCV